MTASAYSLSAAVPSAGFTVTKGEPVLGGLRAELDHQFCPNCMSWLFTRFDAFVNVRVTMLDDPAPFPPFIESCTDEKLPWATTPAVHSFEKFPAPEEYEGLIEEYAKHTKVSADAT